LNFCFPLAIVWKCICYIKTKFSCDYWDIVKQEAPEEYVLLTWFVNRSTRLSLLENYFCKNMKNHFKKTWHAAISAYSLTYTKNLRVGPVKNETLRQKIWFPFPALWTFYLYYITEVTFQQNQQMEYISLSWYNLPDFKVPSGFPW